MPYLPPKEEITTWLTALRECAGRNHSGLHYAGIGDFLLQHGVWYNPSPYADAVYPQGAPKMCFGNSIILAATRGLRYVEGYASAPVGLSVHHAWNMDANGLLVDSTWMNTGLAYFGVEFSVERADDATWNGDGCVLNDHLRKHPLFRKPWKGEDYGIEWPHSERLELLRAGKLNDALSLCRETY
jgi:hypothetical protein